MTRPSSWRCCDSRRTRLILVLGCPCNTEPKHGCFYSARIQRAPVPFISYSSNWPLSAQAAPRENRFRATLVPRSDSPRTTQSALNPPENGLKIYARIRLVRRCIGSVLEDYVSSRKFWRESVNTSCVVVHEVVLTSFTRHVAVESSFSFRLDSSTRLSVGIQVIMAEYEHRAERIVLNQPRTEGAESEPCREFVPLHRTRKHNQTPIHAESCIPSVSDVFLPDNSHLRVSRRWSAKSGCGKMTTEAKSPPLCLRLYNLVAPFSDYCCRVLLKESSYMYFEPLMLFDLHPRIREFDNSRHPRV